MRMVPCKGLPSTRLDCYGCRVFQPTKNAFVDTLQSILDDVKWSLLFLVLTMWGFAGAFYILFREDQDEYQVRSTSLPMYIKLEHAISSSHVITPESKVLLTSQCCHTAHLLHHI